MIHSSTVSGGAPTIIAVGECGHMSLMALFHEIEIRNMRVLDCARNIVLRPTLRRFVAAGHYAITTLEQLGFSGRESVTAVLRRIVDCGYYPCEPQDGLVLRCAVRTLVGNEEFSLVMNPIEISAGIPCILHLTHSQGAVPVLTSRMFVFLDSTFGVHDSIAVRVGR